MTDMGGYACRVSQGKALLTPHAFREDLKLRRSVHLEHLDEPMSRPAALQKRASLVAVPSAVKDAPKAGLTVPQLEQLLKQREQYADSASE